MSPSIYVLVKVSLLFMQLFWARRDFLAYAKSCNFCDALKKARFRFSGAAPIREYKHAFR